MGPHSQHTPVSTVDVAPAFGVYATHVDEWLASGLSHVGPIKRRRPVTRSFPWVCWVQLEDTIAKDLEAGPIVAGDDNRETGIGCRGQKLQDASGYGHIEGGGWFIGDQEAGLGDECSEDGDPLALTA